MTDEARSAAREPSTALRAGIVYLVGAGPGHPALITVRGLECLSACDAVVYDHLADPALLDSVAPAAEKIYVGKQAGRHTLSQSEINRLLIDLARSGKRVVRLKGGDPMIFGRGAEEALELSAAGVEFEIVPGVTAAAGAAAYAGLPLTHRDFASSVVLVTGHEDPRQPKSDIPWDLLARGEGTVVFYMGVGRLEALVERLIVHGRSPRTPAAVVQWAATPRQRTVEGTVGNIAQRAGKAGINPPALLIIGDIVSLRPQLAWFERLPLFGRRIVVTRSRHQASELRLKLESLGAEVIELPTIRLVPPRNQQRLRRAARQVGRYDWVVFTSANAAERFIEAVMDEQGDVRGFGQARIAAIGPATRAAVERYHLAVAAQPDRYIAEEVVGLLRAHGNLEGARILLPRAEKARAVLPEGLRRAGARVDVVSVYRTVAEKPPNRREIVADLRAGRIDLVTFTSSSTVANFVRVIGRRNLPAIAESVGFASIGPVTSATLREFGLQPTVQAAQSTMEGLATAIVRRFGRRKPRRMR